MSQQVSVSYPQALQVGYVAPTLTTSEADIIVITDETFMKKAQLTVYATTNLATNSNTSITLYYYVGIVINQQPSTTATPVTITWIPLCLYATATGIETQRTVVINSTSYVLSNVSSMSDNVPLPAAMAFKITGKYTGGSAAPATTVTLYARDN